ncbi:hypothetical protein Tco_1441005 [Tanacetum coccineum]
MPEGTATYPKDSGGNKQPLDRDITSTTSNEGTAKTTPRPKGSLGDKDSGGNIPPTDMEPIHTPVADPLGTGAKYQADEIQSTRLSDEEEVLAAGDDMDEDPQDDKEVRTPSPKQDQPKPSHVQEFASDSSSPTLKKFDNILPLTEMQLIKYLRKMSRVLLKRITEKQWEHHEEASISYVNLKAFVDQYYDENIADVLSCRCLKKTRYVVSSKFDMAYWAGFLRVRAMFKSISDIIPNLLDLLYLQIVISMDTAYVDNMDSPY